MKIPLIVAQQIGALAAKFDEVFNRNDAGGVAAFCTEDAVRETAQGTSRTSCPQINNREEISHFGAAFSKARKQLKMARLAVVQKASTQNAIELENLGPLELRKGSGGVCHGLIIN
jgi:ketosteroid isomerase-like protein